MKARTIIYRNVFAERQRSTRALIYLSHIISRSLFTLHPLIFPMSKVRNVRYCESMIEYVSKWMWRRRNVAVAAYEQKPRRVRPLAWLLRFFSVFLSFFFFSFINGLHPGILNSPRLRRNHTRRDSYRPLITAPRLFRRLFHSPLFFLAQTHSRRLCDSLKIALSRWYLPHFNLLNCCNFDTSLMWY